MYQKMSKVFVLAIITWKTWMKLYVQDARIDSSRKIDPEENCPPALILTLILNQTLTLTGGQFSTGQFSGHPRRW